MTAKGKRQPGHAAQQIPPFLMPFSFLKEWWQIYQSRVWFITNTQQPQHLLSFPENCSIVVRSMALLLSPRHWRNPSVYHTIDFMLLKQRKRMEKKNGFDWLCSQGRPAELTSMHPPEHWRLELSLPRWGIKKMCMSCFQKEHEKGTHSRMPWLYHRKTRIATMTNPHRFLLVAL